MCGSWVAMCCFWDMIIYLCTIQKVEYWEFFLMQKKNRAYWAYTEWIQAKSPVAANSYANPQIRV